MAERPPIDLFRLTDLSALPEDDLRALSWAALVIAGGLALVLLRSRRKAGKGGGLRLFSRSRCRWRAEPERDDGEFHGWRCARCARRCMTMGDDSPPRRCEGWAPYEAPPQR